MLKYIFTVLFFSFFVFGNAQNIKTIQLRPVSSQQFAPVVPLGSVLELSFDDLDADSKEYQYKIEHMTADWKPSKLSSNQYVKGFNSNYIRTVTNSFNTLQNYTHYSVKIPNQNTIVTKSGNYLISILDEYDEVVFTRRFVLYEQKTVVGVNVTRSRNTSILNTHQTVNFLVNYPKIQINNPAQEVKVVLIKNNNWNTAITGLQPQFFKPNQLIYNYINKTNFWAGNEFRNFDSKNIRNTSLNIAKTEQKEIWHNYLFTDEPRSEKLYNYNPDINGQFKIRTLNGNDPTDEADYATMHFSLDVFEPYTNKDVYVYGSFNDFQLSKENKMTYNQKQKAYQLSIPLKQGFYNYSYATVDKNGKVNLNEVDGSFFQTENEYTVIVYYRPFGGQYDRVIGVGNGFFNQNR